MDRDVERPSRDRRDEVNILGTRVREERERRGMSQSELARVSGTYSATISRLEAGILTTVDANTLARLAGALGVSMDYLYGRQDAMTLEERIAADEGLRYIMDVYTRLPDLVKADILRMVLGYSGSFLPLEQARQIALPGLELAERLKGGKSVRDLLQEREERPRRKRRRQETSDEGDT